MDTSTRGDDSTTAIPDLMKALYDAAVETRPLLSKLSRERLQQLNLFAEQVASGNPFALVLLDVASAVLSVSRDDDTQIVTSADAGDEDPSLWRM